MRKLSVTIAAAMVTLAFANGAVAGLADAVKPHPRLVISKLHLDTRVGSSLALGPAFYPGSARPGQPYTIAIAGHRTTHTRPFWSLDALRRGDRIVLVWRGVRHAYTVTGSRVVAPTDWSIARERGSERLVLTTCTPRFSARQRLVVFAKPTPV